MRSEEIASHIYSAGMAATGTDPLGFRQLIENKRREYYLERGRNQQVTRIFDRIQALQRDIEPLQQLPEEHARLLEQEAALRRRLESLDADLAAKQHELDAARRARSAWGDYEELLAAESSREARGVPPSAASSAEARL